MQLTPRRLLHCLLGTALLLSLQPHLAAAGQECNTDELSLQKSKGLMAAQTHASDNFNGDCQDQAFEADLIASIPQPVRFILVQYLACIFDVAPIDTSLGILTFDP
jgi:hypothetical protein